MVYDTYWELMCHFPISSQMTKLRNQGIKQNAQAEYLFPNLDINGGVSIYIDAEVEERKDRLRTHAYVIESDEYVFKAGTSFDGFHHQAKYPLSSMALFACFLMLWLMCYLVPSTPQEVLPISVVYPLVLLAYGHQLGLLLAMAYEIPSGFRALMT